MATGSVSALDQDTWQLVGTNTVSAGSSTSSFTSLSGYKKYLVVVQNYVPSTGNNLLLRFNGDSTTGNYGGASVYIDTLGASSKTGIPLRGYADDNTSANMTYYAIIENVNNGGPKIVQIGGVQTTAGGGVWVTTDAVTSISFTTTTGTFEATIKLYGIAG